MDSTTTNCRCGHPKSLHRWAATGTACAGCITPDGGTLCWRFRAIEESRDRGDDVSNPVLDIDAIEALWTDNEQTGISAAIDDAKRGVDRRISAQSNVLALVAEVRRLRADARMRWREMTGCDTPHAAREQRDSAVLAEREAWQKALGDIVERHEAIAEKESLAATVSLSSSGLSGRAVGRRAVVADIDTAIRARGEG